MKKTKHDKQFKKGRIPWNKGKKTQVPHLKKFQFKKNHKPWNKGLTIDNPIVAKNVKLLRLGLKKYIKKNGYWYLGKNHWNWKGGITPEITKFYHSIECRRWRKSIYMRDKWICQHCGYNGWSWSGRKLHAHHIKSLRQYPELKLDINNGITLCDKCHASLHCNRKAKV